MLNQSPSAGFLPTKKTTAYAPDPPGCSSRRGSFCADNYFQSGKGWNVLGLIPLPSGNTIFRTEDAQEKIPPGFLKSEQSTASISAQSKVASGIPRFCVILMLPFLSVTPKKWASKPGGTPSHMNLGCISTMISHLASWKAMLSSSPNTAIFVVCWH